VSLIFASGASRAAPAPAPAALEPPTLTFDEFQGRSAAPSAGAETTSFVAPAAPPSLRPGRDGTAALAGLAEPYAGPAYEVDGKWYVPTHEPDYDEVGIASWYGPNFHGKASASGERFDAGAMTAAHPTLPIPSLVRVTNLDNGRAVTVRLNDRGPFVDGRIIDLSRRAAEAIDMTRAGTARVRVEYVGPAPLEPNTTGEGEPGFFAASASPVVAAGLTALPVAPYQPRLAATPARVARPAEPSERGFYVQAGSFVELANAHALRAELGVMGDVFVTEAEVQGTDYYRVMLGPWGSRAEAERAQGRLIEAGRSAFVVAQLR
jgi:rare lipoprotein A